MIDCGQCGFLDENINVVSEHVLHAHIPPNDADTNIFIEKSLARAMAEARPESNGGGSRVFSDDELTEVDEEEHRTEDDLPMDHEVNDQQVVLNHDEHGGSSSSEDEEMHSDAKGNENEYGLLMNGEVKKSETLPRAVLPNTNSNTTANNPIVSRSSTSDDVSTNALPQPNDATAKLNKQPLFKLNSLNSALIPVVPSNVQTIAFEATSINEPNQSLHIQTHKQTSDLVAQYIKQETDLFDQSIKQESDAEQISAQNQPSTSQQLSNRVCKKPKKEEEGGETTTTGEVVWDGDECDCAECRLEREIKIEFLQANETKQPISTGQQNDAISGQPQEWRFVKKEEDHDDGEIKIKVEGDHDSGVHKFEVKQELTDDEQIGPTGSETGDQDHGESDQTEVDQRNDDGFPVDDDADDNEMESDEEEEGNVSDILMNDETNNDVTDGADSDDESDEENSSNDDDNEETEVDENEVEYGDDVSMRDDSDDGERMNESGDHSEGVQESSDELIESDDEDTEVDEEQEDQLPRQIEHVCEQCGKTYKLQTSYSRHMRSHRDVEPIKCLYEGCDKVFTRNDTMQSHFKAHTGETQHKCSHCGKVLHTSSTLKVHMKRHTGDKRFKCSWKDCNKFFVEKTAMTRHYITHLKEKTVKCALKECNKYFADTINMRRHYKWHTKNGLHNCPWEGCKSAYVQKSDLAVHYMKHKGKIPFTCEKCKREFAYSSVLKTHYLTHKD